MPKLDNEYKLLGWKHELSAWVEGGGDSAFIRRSKWILIQEWQIRNNFSQR